MGNAMWDRPDLAGEYDKVSDPQFRSGIVLVDRMRVKAGNTVLDVGCGTGRLAMYMAKIVGPAGRVEGVDPSPYRIRIAEDRLEKAGAKNVRFSRGRGEDLGAFQSGAFRHVCYSSSFHWVEDKPAALGEAFRVLRPGGNLGISTVDRNHHFPMKEIMERLFAEKYKGQAPPEDDFSRMLMSGQELRDLLLGAGFGDVTVDTLPERYCYSSPQELFQFIEASSSGNFLRRLPERLRPRILEDLGRELEKLRTDRGIEMDSETLLAVAYKP